MVKRYCINYRGVTLNYTCSRMNKTQRLSVKGTSSCRLLAQSPDYNTDSNSFILLLHSCILFAHIKPDKGKWSFCFINLFHTMSRKHSPVVRREDLELRQVGIPLLLNRISCMAISQGHRPCENSPPSKIRQKKKFCLLTVICAVLGRHLILVDLMVFRKYIHVHTLHDLK